MSAATVNAQNNQEVRSTSYGYRYESRNLRFTQAERVHTEITLGGHGSWGGYSSYGADLSATRVYTPTKAFGWRWGGMASIDYGRHYGATSDVLAVVGLRLGNRVYVGLDALAGAGQLAYHDHSWHGETDTHDYFNSLWRVKAGGQLSLGVRLGDKVTLSVYGRYLYAFNNPQKRTVTVPEGWEALPTAYHADRFSAGLALTFNIFKETRVSGDNCWQGGIYSGYSFLGNEGWIAGAELLHFERSAARGGAVWGIGSYQVFGSDKSSTNAFYGQGGYRFLPWGSNSVLTIELGAKAGLGEYVKTECGATEDNSFRMSAAGYTLGVKASGYLQFALHFDWFEVVFGGEFGGHYTFGTAFKGEPTYSGTSSNGFGMDAMATAGLRFAF